MRIATLQFSPRLGDIDYNVARAETILRSSIATPPRYSTYDVPGESIQRAPDILILPELALTGYNFPSLAAIRPFLEPTAAGLSTLWAKRVAETYGCIVSIGYPELFTHDPIAYEEACDYRTARREKVDSNHRKVGSDGSVLEDKRKSGTVGDDRITAYNSLITVSPEGDILAHYRKSHLYYTDETWAAESTHGFFSTTLFIPSSRPTSANALHPTESVSIKRYPGKERKASWGICMDINPYQFLPHHYTLHEYASAALLSKSDICVLSMAWLTSLPTSEISIKPDEPDWDTFAYWIDRLSPLVTAPEPHENPHQQADGKYHGASQSSNEPTRSSESPEAKGPPAGHDDGRNDITSNPTMTPAQSENTMTLVVCANRAGEEPGVNPCGQPEGVRYAGSSWIGRLGRGKIEVWGMLGRAEEALLYVEIPDEYDHACVQSDRNGEKAGSRGVSGPEKVFVLRKRQDEDSDHHDDDDDEGSENSS